MSGFAGDIVISSGARKGIKRAMFGKGTSGRVSSARRAAASITKTALARARAPPRKRYSSAAVRNARTGGYLGIETKFRDSSFTGNLVAPTDAAGGEVDPATLLALNSIAQGDGESERDGRQVMVKSCYVSGSIHAPIANAAAASLDQPDIYVALVLDNQTNAAQLNSEDVFTNPSGAALGAAYPLRDLQYTKRFQVLDSVLLTAPTRYAYNDAATTGTMSGWTIPFKLSWSGLVQTNYVGTTAVVASIADTSLHVIAYSSSVSGAPAITYNARVRFVG